MVSGTGDIWISLIRDNFRMLGMDESRPRGIIVLGILIGLGAVFQLVLGFTGQPLYVLGSSLQTGFTVYAYLLYALVSGVIAYGLLTLRKAVFYLAVLWYLWAAVNGAVNYMALADSELLADGVLSLVFVGYVYSKKRYLVH
jgi:hypothetical protein